jgi:D-amino peptidase
VSTVFISVDMEGIAGITTTRQTSRGTDDYPWARRLMTQEANAAAGAAFEIGARHVVVSDSHGDMGNLLPEELDPRAELVQGMPKLPWSMMTGIAEEMTCALFIGYHAGAATQGAILDHTYTGWLADVRVNGESWNETHLNAALAGTFGVPVVFVAGDRACTEQAKAKLPWVRTVATKEGFGTTVGRSFSPKHAQDAIRGITREAIQNAGSAEVWRPEPPFVLECDLAITALGDMLSVAPGTERVAARTVRYEAEDIRTVYRMLLTWMNLGLRVLPPSAPY